MLAKFTVDTSFETPAVCLGDTELEPIGISEDGRVAAECEQTALAMASFEAFPEALTIQVHGSDGFGAHLFHQAEIYRDSDGQLIVEHVCHEPNKYWEGAWGLATFLRAVADQTPFFPDVRIGEIELEDDWKRLTLRVPLEEGAASPALHKTAGTLKRMMREAEIALAGMQWKPEYAKDERVFCEEILAPLLRRMKFISVRYTQGAREYGKDFTLSELTPFGVLRHYSLQAKAGDVSGEVNSAIDELVGQADDAFKMPYYDLASAELRYISSFIVAISGRFTSNAKEKIIHKLPRGLHGSLLSLDREAILELVGRYWAATG